MLYARLHSPVTKCLDRYSVSFDGEVIVVSSRTAEMDAARVLLARGIKGPLTFLDATSGKPRVIVDIEKAAKLTVREDRRGMSFVKYRPMPADAHRSTDSPSQTAEEASPGSETPNRSEAALDKLEADTCAAAVAPSNLMTAAYLLKGEAGLRELGF
jgi:hypothetical protein